MYSTTEIHRVFVQVKEFIVHNRATLKDKEQFTFTGEFSIPKLHIFLIFFSGEVGGGVLWQEVRENMQTQYRKSFLLPKTVYTLYTCCLILSDEKYSK